MNQVTDTVDYHQSDILLLLERTPYYISPLIRSVFAQDKEHDVLILLVGRQSGKREYPVQDFVAVAFALFRVDIQDSVLA